MLLSVIIYDTQSHIKITPPFLLHLTYNIDETKHESLFRHYCEITVV